MDPSKVRLSSFSVVHWQLLSIQPTLKSSFFPQGDFTGESCLLLSIVVSFWVRDRSMYLLLLALGPQLVQPCAGHVVHCFCLCKFICEVILLCLEGPICLVTSIPSGSYILSTSSLAGFPEPKEEGLIEASHLRLSVPMSLNSLCVLSGCGSLYLVRGDLL